MKDKIFGVLQRVGRSFMLPIADPAGSRPVPRRRRVVHQ